MRRILTNRSVPDSDSDGFRRRVRNGFDIFLHFLSVLIFFILYSRERAGFGFGLWLLFFPLIFSFLLCIFFFFLFLFLLLFVCLIARIESAWGYNFLDFQKEHVA